MLYVTFTVLNCRGNYRLLEEASSGPHRHSSERCHADGQGREEPPHSPSWGIGVGGGRYRSSSRRQSLISLYRELF